jgi:hypothetical protein
MLVPVKFLTIPSRQLGPADKSQTVGFSCFNNRKFEDLLIKIFTQKFKKLMRLSFNITGNTLLGKADKVRIFMRNSSQEVRWRLDISILEYSSIYDHSY